MIRNELRTIICYLLCFIMIFLFLQPEQVFGLGYVKDDQTEFETGDILEPGKPYHLNNIKFLEYYNDGEKIKNYEIVETKNTMINNLYLDMFHNGTYTSNCADIKKTEDGFDVTMKNISYEYEDDDDNYIIDAIRRYYPTIDDDKLNVSYLSDEYNSNNTNYSGFPSISFIVDRDNHKYLAYITYKNRDDGLYTTVNINDCNVTTEEDLFGDRIKTITLPEGETFFLEDKRTHKYVNTEVNKIVLSEEQVIYKESHTGIKVSNLSDESASKYFDTKRTKTVEYWYDEDGNERDLWNWSKYSNGNVSILGKIDPFIKLNCITYYYYDSYGDRRSIDVLVSISCYNSDARPRTYGVDNFDFETERDCYGNEKIKSISWKDSTHFYATNGVLGINRHAYDMGTKITLSYSDDVYKSTLDGKDYRDLCNVLVDGNNKPFYDIHILCSSITKNSVVYPNLNIGDTFNGGDVYTFIFAESKSKDENIYYGGSVNGNYFGIGSESSNYGWLNGYFSSSASFVPLSVAWNNVIDDSSEYKKGSSPLDASYLFYKNNDTILSTLNGDRLDFKQINNLSYNQFYEEVINKFDGAGFGAYGTSVLALTVKFPGDNNTTWIFKGCKNSVCYFSYNSPTSKVEYYNRRDYYNTSASPIYTKDVNNGDSLALTDDEKQFDCFSDFTFDKYYDEDENEIDIENTRAHSIVEKVYLADKYCDITYEAFDRVHNDNKRVYSLQLKGSELSLSDNNYTYKDNSKTIVSPEQISQNIFSGYNLTKFYDYSGNILTSEDTNQDNLYAYVLKDDQVMVQYKSTDEQITLKEILNQGEIANKLSKSDIAYYNDYESYNLDKYYSSNTVTDATTLVDMSQQINEDTTLWFKKDGCSVTYKDKRTDEPIYVKEVPKNGDGHLTEEEINNKDELKDYKTDKYYESKDSDKLLDDNKLNNVIEDTTVYLKDKYCYVTYKDKETTNPIVYSKVSKDSNGSILKIDETDTKKYYDSTTFTNEVNKDTVFSGYDISKIYDANNTEIDTSTIDLTNLDDIEIYVQKKAHVHTPNDGAKENEIPATCTENGSYDWVRRCNDCNEIISSEARTYDKTGHKWDKTWQNISSDTDIDALINGAENKDTILNSWVKDDYHKLQIQYCKNTWDCVRGQTEKAYRLRVLRFEFVYKDDGENGGYPDKKPDVTVDVYEEPKEQDDEPEHKIGTIDTTVDEQPIVQPENPETEDPYVPYIVTPKDNPYDYNHPDTRNYSIPTVTITVGTNKWKEFLNTITFGIFFKDTQTGTITYEFKNPNEWNKVETISYIVTKGGQVYNSEEIKNISDWTVGTSFTIEKEDTQKYVVYSDIKLGCGYEFNTSSDGMIMDSVSPTIECQTKDDVILFPEEKITIEDNTKLDKVYVDGEEKPVDLNEDGNKTEIVVPNDGKEHTIKAVDKAGNDTEKVIKFSKSDFKATVEGYIRDIDGKPVSGATVELHSTLRTATTDEYGKFSFDNVEVDRHDLSAYVNNDKIYAMSLALTPTYVQTELKEVKGTYKVASEFTVDDKSLLVRVNADECQNHTHGHERKENETNPTCTKKGSYDLVDICPNCGGEYSRLHIITNALGHIWDNSESEWVLIKNPTQELFDGAENKGSLNFNSLTSADKVYKRLCHRAQDAYDIKVVSATSTPTPTPDPTPDKPNPDTPNPDTPKLDTPNPDNPNPDTPNPDTPKPDTPNPDNPNQDKPNPDKPVKYTVTVIDRYNGKDNVRTKDIYKEGEKYSYKAKSIDGYEVVGKKSETGVVKSNIKIIFKYNKKKPVFDKVTIKVYDCYGNSEKLREKEKVNKGTSYYYEAKETKNWVVKGNDSYFGIANKDIVIKFHYNKRGGERPKEPKTGNTKDIVFEFFILAGTAVILMNSKKARRKK